jgi:hypothetical protein
MTLTEVRNLRGWLAEFAELLSNPAEATAERLAKAKAVKEFSQKNLREPTSACPWCQSVVPPGANDEGDERHRKINPCKCPECGGVGGYEDWMIG